MKTIIHQCSVEEIEKIWKSEPFILHVQFKNGRHVTHKIDTALRMFLASIQHATFARSSETYYILSKLGFHDLLGFEINDTAHIQVFGQNFFIRFSDS